MQDHRPCCTMASPAMEVKTGDDGGRLTETDINKVIMDLKRHEWGRFRVLGKEDKRRVVSEACTRWNDENLLTILVDRCDSDMLNGMLTTLAERDMWRSVGGVLKRGVSDSERRWAVENACTQCNDDVKLKELVRWCDIDMLDNFLTTLVERSMWRSVGKVLQRGVSDSKRRQVVYQVCRHGDDEVFKDDILDYCVDEELDSMLTTLVERGMWLSVGKVLERGVSDLKQWRAVHEACKQADDVLFSKTIAIYCDDNLLDTALTLLVERDKWMSVRVVLERGVSDSLQRWAVEEASQRADDLNISKMLPFCTSDALDCVLKSLVERGKWEKVSEVLKRVVSDSQHSWAVQEACKRAHKNIVLSILKFCPDYLLESVLKTLVERRVWRCVGAVLKRGVSDSLHSWAVQEAFNRVTFDDFDIINDIVPLCADGEQLGCVLRTLVGRGMWKFVQQVLKRGVSESQQRWAVQEALNELDHRTPRSTDAFYGGEHYVVAEIIATYCAQDQVFSALTRLMVQHKWGYVNEMLRREVACERPAADTDVFRFLCTDHDVDCALTKFAKHQKWYYLERFFQECWPRSRSLTIPTVFKVADEGSIIRHILPDYQCLKLDCTVKQLAAIGKWRVVGELLHHCVMDLFTCDSLHLAWRNQNHNTSQLKNERFWDLVEGGRGLVKRLPYKTWNKVCKERWTKLLNTTSRTRHQFVSNEEFHQLEKNKKERITTDALLCEAVMESVRELWIHGLGNEVPAESCLADEQDEATVDQMMKYVEETCSEEEFTDSSGLSLQTNTHCDIHSDRKQFSLAVRFLIRIMNRYGCKLWKRDSENKYERERVKSLRVLVLLSNSPVFPRVQSVLLHVLLRHEMWDILSEACLSHVVEQDRRRLFHAALEQKQLKALRRWADHTVYDNKRLWAMEEAFKEKLWEAYLLLSDYGINETERIGVYCRLVRYADWDIVQLMMDTVADASEVKELLMSKILNPTECPKVKHKDAPDPEERLRQMNKYEDRLRNKTKCLKTLKSAVKRREWCIVRRLVRHNPRPHNVRVALRAAVQQQHWPVVMQMVRLEGDPAQIDALFREMVERQQWAVCRVLLEQQVSDQVCLELLPQLIDHRQWQLVSMVMECEMDDGLRRLFMQHALEAREGSVVWQCINAMENRLTVKEREEMFQRAFSRDVWQTVKSLLMKSDTTGIQHCDDAVMEALEQWQLVFLVMECEMDEDLTEEIMQRALEGREKDEESVVWQCIIHSLENRLTFAEREVMFQQAFNRDVWQTVMALIEKRDALGVQHRDIALLEAIDQHQWDVVDYCLRYKADINMADDNSHTPIHRSARERDWKAVKELAVRGGDTSLLDTSGQSVLHRAIDARRWDMVELLIEYHGNIHQPDTVRGLSPLRMLIDARQGDLILLTLRWCPNQGLGLNARGETPLHAVCLSVKLQDLPADDRALAAERRGLDLLVTRGVKPSAVTRQGLSALAYAVLNETCPQRMVEECIRLGINKDQPDITDTALLGEPSLVWDFPLLASPMLLAVLRGLPDVTRTLYEAGTCSTSELAQLGTLVSLIHRTDRIPDNVSQSFTQLCRELIGGVPEWTEEGRQKSVKYLMQVIPTHDTSSGSDSSDEVDT